MEKGMKGEKEKKHQAPKKTWKESSRNDEREDFIVRVVLPTRIPGNQKKPTQAFDTIKYTCRPYKDGIIGNSDTPTQKLYSLGLDVLMATVCKPFLLIACN